jgi:uncharacterized spore protein YtfJ
MALGIHAGCAAQKDAGSTSGSVDEGAEISSGTGTGVGTSEGSEAGESSQGESTGAQPDPAAIQVACDDSCEMVIECQPEVIPKNYESLEDCVGQCIEGLELNYADGCGPIMLMRIICWADLSCEDWLEFVDTGYSSCGDDPGVQWCGD